MSCAKNSRLRTQFPLARDGLDRGHAERKIEHARSLSRRVLRELAGLAGVVGDFAEDVEFGMPFARARSSIAGTNFTQNSGFTWRAVFDAETVDPGTVDPRSVDFDHPVDDARMLGEEVVEAHEIAHRAGLRRERRVAAVVIIDRLVEPGGIFAARPLGFTVIE